MSRPWNPSASITLSIAFHGAAGAGVLIAPTLWPWALGAVAADHLLLTIAGLWPRSTLLGPNLVRVPDAAVTRRQVALTIDDGPDPEATPQVLDLLDAAGVKASFFCIGRRARQYPALCREIAARGHRVENHGDSHSRAFAAFGYARICDDIARAQAALSDITGQKPRFFRPPAACETRCWTRSWPDWICASPAEGDPGSHAASGNPGRNHSVSQVPIDRVLDEAGRGHRAGLPCAGVENALPLARRSSAQYRAGQRIRLDSGR